jgi:sugar lactone lactonase YvrE
MSRKLDVREHEFARLDLTANPPPATPGTRAKEVVGGFEALGGAALDSHGTLYFVDRNLNRIYAWTQEKGLDIVSSHPLDPVAVAVDKSDNLLVLSSSGLQGSVYSLKPDGLDGALTKIEAEPTGTHPNAAVVLPANWWVNGEFKDQYDPATDHFATISELFTSDVATAPAKQYASPDGSIVLPAYRVFHQGPPDNRGWRFSHSLDTYGFLTAKPGTRVYVSSAGDAKTYSATVGPNGELTNLQMFVERGGESVATDATGRVYVANGQVFVYGPDKQQLGVIEVPGGRPLQLLVSGQTLFVLTHHALYSVNLPGAM